MKHPRTSCLSLLAALAISLAPMGQVLADGCPSTSSNGCTTSSSATESACVCCRPAVAAEPSCCGANDDKPIPDREPPAGKCGCCAVGVTTQISALELPIVPIISLPPLDPCHYSAEIVHPSDWVLRILRPPSC